MQQVPVCNANGVVMSLFLCFFKLHLFFVLCNQDPSTSNLLYARGITGSNDMPYHTLWTENWGVPLCKKTI